jgi:hypothetical protein
MKIPMFSPVKFSFSFSLIGDGSLSESKCRNSNKMMMAFGHKMDKIQVTLI